MIKKIFKCFFIYSLLFSTQAFSENIEIKAKIEQNFDKTVQNVLNEASKQKFFLVEFTQSSFSLLRNKVTESSGLLYIKKPYSFRYEILKPRNELYVSNGKDFWKYIESLKHAQYLKNSAQELGFINILTNLAQIKKYYIVSEWTDEEAKKLNHSANMSSLESDIPPEKNNDYILLKLVPKGDKQQKVLYARVQVKTGLIQELRIVQLNGNRIRLVFSNYSQKPISDDVFNFTPPQGIAVDKM
ncbi:LolA family protein [Fluviispira vulneris]|uniref:LolA family protein n=1 Tax=Fluviispira vulneris TaxID=2763012 RepID=UPI0016447882|nr:outer membrane lipoprotein carrier protein LolA [Fluviispira vulneris]